MLLRLTDEPSTGRERFRELRCRRRVKVRLFVVTVVGRLRDGHLAHRSGPAAIGVQQIGEIVWR
jgi:hypothetical protein